MTCISFTRVSVMQISLNIIAFITKPQCFTGPHRKAVGSIQSSTHWDYKTWSYIADSSTVCRDSRRRWCLSHFWVVDMYCTSHQTFMGNLPAVDVFIIFVYTINSASAISSPVAACCVHTTELCVWKYIECMCMYAICMPYCSCKMPWKVTAIIFTICRQYVFGCVPPDYMQVTGRHKLAMCNGPIHTVAGSETITYFSAVHWSCPLSIRRVHLPITVTQSSLFTACMQIKEYQHI